MPSENAPRCRCGAGCCAKSRDMYIRSASRARCTVGRGAFSGHYGREAARFSDGAIHITRNLAQLLRVGRTLLRRYHGVSGSTMVASWLLNASPVPQRSRASNQNAKACSCTSRSAHSPQVASSSTMAADGVSSLTCPFRSGTCCQHVSMLPSGSERCLQNSRADIPQSMASTRSPVAFEGDCACRRGVYVSPRGISACKIARYVYQMGLAEPAARVRLCENHITWGAVRVSVPRNKCQPLHISFDMAHFPRARRMLCAARLQPGTPASHK